MIKLGVHVASSAVKELSRGRGEHVGSPRMLRNRPEDFNASIGHRTMPKSRMIANDPLRYSYIYIYRSFADQRATRMCDFAR